ncbi:MAG: hypothetical protein AB8B73_00105 [Ekhidna sp.]
MRLGQFARKYDIRVQDIISYLNKKDEEIHSNTKLSDEDESEILDFFGIEPEEEVIEPPQVDIVESQEKIEESSEIEEEKPVEDEDAWIEQDEPVIEEKSKKKSTKEKAIEVPKESKPLPSTPEEDIALAEGELDVLPSPEDRNEDIANQEESKKEIEVVPPVEDEKKLEPKEDEVIDTDRLMELLESEEEIPELDKIKLIKASKKELSGLKVLGKVDLPEPKKKEAAEEEKEERKVRDKKSKPVDDDWEERRLKAKAKRLKNEARVAKLKKEKEERERIARNAVHYKQKLTSVPAKKKVKAKKKPTVQVEKTHSSPNLSQSKSKKQTQKEQPKSALGKMWKWLTNPDQ